MTDAEGFVTLFYGKGPGGLDRGPCELLDGPGRDPDGPAGLDGRDTTSITSGPATLRDFILIWS